MALSLQPIPDPRWKEPGSALASPPAASFGNSDGETYGRIFRLSSAFARWVAAEWTSRHPETE